MRLGLSVLGAAEGSLEGCTVGDPLGSYVGQGVTGMSVGFFEGDCNNDKDESISNQMWRRMHDH